MYIVKTINNQKLIFNPLFLENTKKIIFPNSINNTKYANILAELGEYNPDLKILLINAEISSALLTKI